MKRRTGIGFNRFRKCLLVMVALCSSLPYVIAQEDRKNYKFIAEEANRFYFSGDSGAFAGLTRLIGQMNDKQAKRVTVVHIGGSHVQGGIWSNAFVTALQNNFGTRGGGYFVFPYKLAKTNGQPYAVSFSGGKWKKCRALGKDYCQPLGMCAMNVSTNDSLNNFGVRLTDRATCKAANVVRVMHNGNRSFAFKPAEEFKYQVADDTVSGETVFRFESPLDSVNFTVEKRDTLQKDFVLYGISVENDLEPGFYLAGLGANGASSSSFLRCGLLVQQLKSIHPDMVILSLGVNDTQSKGFEKEEYIEHYDSLIAKVKQANPGAFILLTTTTDNFIKRKTSNKRTISAHDAMFELMKKHNVAVWDLFTIMGGYKSMTRWYKAGLAARDKVHFTAKGYNILGNMMSEAFMKAYSGSKKVN